MGGDLRHWFGLSAINFRAIMRQMRGRRGGVELAHLLDVIGHLVRYFGLERAIDMIQQVMRALARGMEAPADAPNYLPIPDEDSEDDDWVEPPVPGCRPPKPTHTVPRHM